MKLYKAILALTALIVIIFDEAGSQKLFPPISPPPIRPPITPSPPPPPPPTLSPSLPPSPTTPSVSPTPSFSSSVQPSPPPSSSALPSSSSEAPKSSSAPSPTPSSSKDPSQFDCSVFLACSDPKTYCDIPAGKCRLKGNLGDRCNSDNSECSEPLVCRENTCGYSDVGTTIGQKNDDKHYNVKKVAIVGALIVGVSSIFALVFFMIRYLKKKRDYDIASRLYSTDDDMSETDPYPFAERSNSFSQNTVQPPRVPNTNRYDNLPPAANRGYVAPRPVYHHNYYNKYNNEGLYLRQNRQNDERTMNLLQQTRGNVMITPQQNYNYPPAIRVNQGGLFPIPSVNGNHAPPPNNANSSWNPNDVNSDHTNDHNTHNMRRDSNTLSADDVTFESDSNYDDKKETNNKSVLNNYANESIFAKTLEAKLSKSSVNYNNTYDTTILQGKK